MLRRTSSLALLALLAFPAHPAAQETPAVEAERPEVEVAVPLPVFGEVVSVPWVLVPVVVRGPEGYATGLERRHFRLWVDDRPVAIESFERRAEAPVSLVVLQDLSGSMAVGGKLEASRAALDFFLDRFETGDELAIASFAGGRLRVDVPFTSDLAALRDAMTTWRAHGSTGLHDAVAWLPEITVGERNAKRAALLVTDGADNASTLPAGRAREIVRRARLPVYVLGLGTGDPYALDSEGGKRHRYADLLNLLAHMTGGRYHSVPDPSAVDSACAEIADDLRFQYVLGFSTRASGEESFHRVRVEVDARRRDRVLYRRGYHGAAPAGNP